MIYLYKCKIDKDCSYQSQHQVSLNLLERHFGYLPEIKVTEKGKPYFTKLNNYFSVSHCKKMVVVAISNTEIGIDVEITRNTNKLVMKKMYHEHETNVIDEDCDFTKIWTCKESYGKMLGVGVVYDMKAHDFSKVVSTNSFSIDTGYIKLLTVDDVYICVCSSKDEDIISIDVTLYSEKI